MKDAMLIELAMTWELQAETGGDGLNKLAPPARETLRACADTLRMLVDAQRLLPETAGDERRHVICLCPDCCAATVEPAPTDSVPMPQNEDQATLMALLGENWLRENAPHRLRAPPPQQVEPGYTPELVEERLNSWRQRQMNRSGDRLALDDFMGQESIDDLIDFVCEPAAPKEPKP